MSTGEDWLDQARRLAAGLGQTLAAAAAAPADGEAGPPHGADCRWCPLCQAMAVLRGERPEVTAALADALGAASAALRALAAEPPPAPDAEPAPEQSAAQPGAAGPPVQHIEIA